MKPYTKDLLTAFTMKVINAVQSPFHSVGCPLFLCEKTTTLTFSCEEQRVYSIVKGLVVFCALAIGCQWLGSTKWSCAKSYRRNHQQKLSLRNIGNEVWHSYNLILWHLPNYIPDVIANTYPFRLDIFSRWAQLCFQTRHCFICLLLFADLWLVWASRKCRWFYLSHCHSFTGWRQRRQKCYLEN